ncbi:cell division protein FtsZ [Candidatus Fermentibacteria bacterium]|nr:cell division protein FtsZ [Candidatus Fermentibacteria bacterium]
MTFRIMPADEPVSSPTGATLKVIGVGGCGGNAVNRMITERLDGVEFITVNTDCQDLAKSLAEKKVAIGAQATAGRGCGGNPEVGQRAIEESETDVREVLEGANMVFITAGMGGGTGTGASPVVARIARELDALTVAVVTKPFRFEGPMRMRAAERGIAELRKYANTLITIPNDRLLSVVPERTPLRQALMEGDRILRDATRGIVEIITNTGEWNRDFSDVRSVMSAGGDAIMGIGQATGEDRALQAAEVAITSQLLEDTSIRGARSVLLRVAGDDSMALHEVHTCLSVVQEGAGGQADIKLAIGVDPSLDGAIRVTVIATGFGTGTTGDTDLLGDDRSTLPFGPRKRKEDDDPWKMDLPYSTIGAVPGRNEGRDPSPGRDPEIAAFLRRQAD